MEKERKNMKKHKRWVAFISGCLMILVLLAGCGKPSYEKLLEGTWYLEGSSSSQFELYSDGTCKITGEYGTGEWSVVNDDQLKLTNFYGETQTVTIVDIEDGCMTLTNDNGDTVQMWNTPQE